jgi:hypothetical protein
LTGGRQPSVAAMKTLLLIWLVMSAESTVQMPPQREISASSFG